MPMIIDAIDINSIIEKVDINQVVQRVDVDEIVSKVDVDKIVDRVDIEAIIDRVDMQKIIDRIDINKIVEGIDIDALVEQTELGSIIARSTTGIVTEVLDVIRAQGVGLDDFVFRWGNRLVDAGPRSPTGPWAHPSSSLPRPPRDGDAGPFAGADRRPPGPLRRRRQPARRVRRRRRRLVGPLHDRRRPLRHVLPSRHARNYSVTNHQILALVILVVWEFLYYTYQWGVSGRTIGMAVFGLQVVTVEGGRITMRQAAVRTLGLALCIATLGIGFLGIVYQRERRGLDDLVAKTAVVYSWDARAARLRWMARTESPQHPSAFPHQPSHGQPEERAAASVAVPESGIAGPSTMPVHVLHRSHEAAPGRRRGHPEPSRADERRWRSTSMIPFRDALRELGPDNSTRLVVITGVGRGFCSGADHENPGSIPHIDGLTLPTIALRSMEMLDDVMATIRRLHQPVIVAVNGAAIGGGFCLALVADIRVVFRGRLTDAERVEDIEMMMRETHTHKKKKKNVSGGGPPVCIW